MLGTFAVETCNGLWWRAIILEFQCLQVFPKVAQSAFGV